MPPSTLSHQGICASSVNVFKISLFSQEIIYTLLCHPDPFKAKAPILPAETPWELPLVKGSCVTQGYALPRQPAVRDRLMPGY